MAWPELFLSSRCLPGFGRAEGSVLAAWGSGWPRASLCGNAHVCAQAQGTVRPQKSSSVPLCGKTQSDISTGVGRDICFRSGVVVLPCLPLGHWQMFVRLVSGDGGRDLGRNGRKKEMVT